MLKGLLDSLFEGQPRRPFPLGSEQDEMAMAQPQCQQASERTWEMCGEHGGKMELFCTQDEELLCLECLQEEHEDHITCSTQEAFQDCKTDLRSAIMTLQEKMESRNTLKQNLEDVKDHIKKQSHHTERLIRAEFEKLHKFLRDEETAMVTALKEEAEEKSGQIKDRLEKLKGDIASLTDAINTAEEAIDTDEMTFLRSYKKLSERTQCNIPDPPELSDALIDVASHVGCLTYKVWEKMQTIIQYYPITLDPNTADACLSVSDDLLTVHYIEEEQHLPDNPERFSSYECVLGSEGICSGCHAWDVEVGECSEWALGVVTESVQRKKLFPPSPERGLWTICLCAGEYRARTFSNPPLAPKRKPKRVRVQMDYERGRVTFSDPSDNALLYQFKNKFQEMVFPYFSNTCKHHPLRLSSGKITIMADDCAAR